MDTLAVQLVPRAVHVVDGLAHELLGRLQDLAHLLPERHRAREEAEEGGSRLLHGVDAHRLGALALRIREHAHGGAAGSASMVEGAYD